LAQRWAAANHTVVLQEIGVDIRPDLLPQFRRQPGCARRRIGNEGSLWSEKGPVTRIANLERAPEQGISAGNRLMGVNAGVAVAAKAQHIGVQPMLYRRPVVSRDTRKIVEAEHTNILRAHRVIIGCRGSDCKILVIDTTGDISSGSSEISFVG